MKLLVVLILIVGFLYSCYTTQPTATRNILRSYVGYSENVVIKNFGPPTRVTSDGSSGKILVYEDIRRGTMYMPGFRGDSPYYPMYTSTVTRTNYINFFINENGDVYHWRTNYPATEQVLDKRRTRWLYAGTIATFVSLFGILLILELTTPY